MPAFLLGQFLLCSLIFKFLLPKINVILTIFFFHDTTSAKNFIC